MDKKKVLVAMSGGVDSSVSALILKKQGFDVIGITITPFKINEECRTEENLKSCCSYKSLQDAKTTAEQIGIPHYLIELTETFREKVVEYFIEEYLQGRTPNPCVRCNRLIKWTELLKKADQFGAFYLATGHYARVEKDEDKIFLKKGLDINKDQSYFLWNLTVDQLKRTILPLGNFKKPQIRKIAKENNLLVHNKVESQEICFIPNNNYHHFLISEFEKKNINIEKGDIVFRGKVVGQHKGYPFYTIGQRKGLGISYSQPLFVKKIDVQNNIIFVETEDNILSRGLIATDFNFISPELLKNDKLYTIKVRYKDRGSLAYCKINALGELEIHFQEKRRAITPGQSVVIYDEDILIGGGIIKNSLD